jgi:Zn-dependent protease with chaperone function
MTTHVSIISRALLAIVLMIGFYLLALAISAALLYVPYAEVVYAHRVTPKLFLICILGALAILWAILPRFDKFPAPGPRLKPDKHPRLFKELESVAAATGQAMPVEVYAIPDVNAWVSQRGGIMGFGSRRVMGLGLPLMRTLTCSQFRAVLAHEFGHFHSGDTRVGPWIYKTRNTIGRTLSSLGRSKLQLPFVWYGNMFLRVTHAISRRQEYVADALAARTVGAKPLADGLRAVHGTGLAFNAYWQNECAPVLHAGFHPPLVEGFAHFIQANEIAEAINKHVDEELKTGKANPYDSHPPLKDRIAAVANLPAGNIPAEDPLAISLLENVPSLESELLVTIAGPEAAQKLKPVLWKDVGAQVYLTQWKQLAKANAAALKGVTPESLPQVAADSKEFGLKLVDWRGMGPANGGATALAGGVLGAALIVLLLEHGASIDTSPGSAITVTKGETTVEPFNVVNGLLTGKIAAAAWLQQCAALGINGVDLSTVE